MEKKLRALIKEAMLAKRQEASVENVARSITFTSILDNAQKVVKDKRIDTNNGIPDTYIIDAAKKEVKQLNELLTFCTEDMIDKKAEITFKLAAAQELLPTMTSEADIIEFIKNNKDKYSNIGAMMKALKEKFGDSLDGKKASTLVKEYL